MAQAHPSFGERSTLKSAMGRFQYASLPRLEAQGLGKISRMPFSIKILLESVLRQVNGFDVKEEDIRALCGWNAPEARTREFPFKPARVVMQDFTGVPAIVDLAAMRDAMQDLGGDPQRINPIIPVDLVIDHSVQVDLYASSRALAGNATLEFQRNQERYEFLRWGSRAFSDFRVVPPATGIVHQVNLEFLARVVQVRTEPGSKTATVFPDTVVGTDSHTPMINGIGVLGWGVGGIEAEAALLGQPLYMLIPEVVGVRLSGSLREGVTATDLVLTVTQMLRKLGVVDKIVEFFGPGLASLSVADRATIGNMSPEYGATAGFFPVDEKTLEYLRFTGRSPELVDLVERYCKEQGLFRGTGAEQPEYTTTVELDLATVETSLAGPKRPQDRIPLSRAKGSWRQAAASANGALREAEVQVGGERETLRDGAVVIAAITSCTNTSNPAVMLAAGLLAQKAVHLGLRVPAYVKTSFAPGSKVVTQYLDRAGLSPYLEALGFHVVGYGCTTCIGNSGPLAPVISAAIKNTDLTAVSVLSGNRNFEGRIHPEVKANYLASPPLVVAYALAGTMEIDLAQEPIGKDHTDSPVYLRDIWPTLAEIDAALKENLTPEMFHSVYANVFSGDEAWNKVKVPEERRYSWSTESTYIRKPSFFEGIAAGTGRYPQDPGGARARGPRGFGDHRSHLPCRGHTGKEPGRQMAASKRRESRGLQHLWLTEGQPRGAHQGNFRKHPHPQQDDSGRGRRIHAPSSVGRANGHLRRCRALCGREGPAHRDCGQGIRLRQLPRLGGQGPAPFRGARDHRGKLRADPPLEPDRHGHSPAAVRAGRKRGDPRAHRRGGLRDRACSETGPGARRRCQRRGGEKRFTVTARINSEVELSYYRNGGILPTVLRGFASGR